MPAAHNNAVAVSWVSLATKSAIAPQAALTSCAPGRPAEWRSPRAISRTWYLYRGRGLNKPGNDARVQCFATTRRLLTMSLPNFGRPFGIKISLEQRTPVFLETARNHPLGLGFSHATSSKAAGNDHLASPAPAEIFARLHDPLLHCRRRYAQRWKRRGPAELLPVFLPTGRPARLARDSGPTRRAGAATLRRPGRPVFDDVRGEQRRALSGSGPSLIGRRSDLSAPIRLLSHGRAARHHRDRSPGAFPLSGRGGRARHALRRRRWPERIRMVGRRHHSQQAGMARLVST